MADTPAHSNAQDYDAHAIEQDAQDYWERNACFRVTEDTNKRKFYCLSMWPYPSGDLHIGHVRNYTLGDVCARYQMMQGANVLQPIGWDAFGLPAENAAIENGLHPAQWTRSNIANMSAQLKRLGFAYDWSRELSTHDPDYYRWEQWFFTKLFQRGDVYRAQAVVNWDPVEQTTLANEQVIDGKGYRSGALVERKELEQWFLRITAYADELLEELQRLDGWSHAVRTMQHNWIGRSEGATVRFKLKQLDEHIEVFTTRADTLFGVSWLALSCEHPLVTEHLSQDDAVQAFIRACAQPHDEAMDMVVPNWYAEHPLSAEAVPILISDMVVAGYGTGAVMGVAAHDERDWSLCQRMNLSLRPVVRHHHEHDYSQSAMTEDGVLINSGIYTGLSSSQARLRMVEDLKAQNLGYAQVQYRLNDWNVSRQRYWGCPIPIIHCPDCGLVPVPEHDLPVRLPEDIRFDGPRSPLHDHPDWVNVPCPQCGTRSKRETDTLDTFFESSWYFARFCCPDADQSMLDERVHYWMPVDQYIGGIEHAILHLLYARYFQKLMADLNLVRDREPFKALLNQGMVLKEFFYRKKGAGLEYFSHDQVHVRHDAAHNTTTATLKADDSAVSIGSVEKMSKSKRNGVNPDRIVERYGADTLRTYVMFTSEPVRSLEWNDDALAGCHRFLRRLWNSVQKAVHCPPQGHEHDAKADILLRIATHRLLQRIQQDYERLHYNTVVSSAMEMLNAHDKHCNEHGHTPQSRQTLENLLLILNPISPHLCHHLWCQLKQGHNILQSGWPEVDVDLLAQQKVVMVLQINGKVRGQMQAESHWSKQQCMEQARLCLQRQLQGKQCKKVIVVPSRIVNFVV